MLLQGDGIETYIFFQRADESSNSLCSIPAKCSEHMSFIRIHLRVGEQLLPYRICGDESISEKVNVIYLRTLSTRYLSTLFYLKYVLDFRNEQ